MNDLEERLLHHEKLQQIIRCALNISLETASLDLQVAKMLDLILSIPGISLVSKGCIFLVDESGKNLRLVASRGLPESQIEICGRIPFGYCLCGRAAESREGIFSSDLDERHDVNYDGILPHGHYCVPILSGSRLLGVINTYIPSGHVRDKTEEDFLFAIATTLAGIIERKQGEMALRQARDDLDLVVRRQTTKGMFNPFVIERLLDLWRKDEAQGIAVPNPVHVGQMLEVVFQASLQRKEEASIELSVSLLPLDGFRAKKSDQCTGMYLLFDTPISFRVDALVALARSFDPVTTTLGVVPSRESPDGLEICGAIYFNCASQHRFDAHTFNRTPADMLTVMVRKAGCLQVFKGTDAIGGFDSGFFSEPNPPPFTDSPLAWNLLLEVQKHQGYDKFGMGYWRVYRDFIDRVLLETASKKNGGTIIWLPQAHVGEAWKAVEPRFSLAESPDGADFLVRFRELEVWSQENRGHVQWHKREMERMRLKRELLGFADLLSRLTRVDGAMFISDHLRPLAFGAMITAKPWKGGIVSWVEEKFFPSVRMDLKKLGARHTSAVNFVGQCPGAVAFVISQDGPVAGLVKKDENTLYWWPDCLGGLRDS